LLGGLDCLGEQLLGEVEHALVAVGALLQGLSTGGVEVVAEI
jgi:hypothetical protein